MNWEAAKVQCENCKYARVNSEAEYSCQRYPPMPVDRGGDRLYSYYPVVDAADWCGEFVVEVVDNEG